MKRTAFIWQKSIYDNDFRCNICGAKLFDLKKGKLVEKNVGVFRGNDTDLFCIKCENHVAHIQTIDYDGDEVLLGEWKGKIENGKD